MPSLLSKLRSTAAPLRIVVFALILLAVWLPIALPLRWLIRNENLAGIVTLVILYAQFLVLVRYWGRKVHRQHQVFRSYGLDLSRHNGLLVLRGLGMGLGSVGLLFFVQTVLGWIQWQVPSFNILKIIVEGLLVALAIGFAEELLFRGWMLDELQRDYAPIVVLWANAILFAALHFRLWTLPALVFLGVALVWAKRSHRQTRLGKRYDLLGLPIGLHAGLVWGNYIVEVGQLVQYPGRVPEWVTGLDRNPMAGVLGCVFLAGLAWSLWQYAIAQRRSSKL